MGAAPGRRRTRSAGRSRRGLPAAREGSARFALSPDVEVIVATSSPESSPRARGGGRSTVGGSLSAKSSSRARSCTRATGRLRPRVVGTIQPRQRSSPLSRSKTIPAPAAAVRPSPVSGKRPNAERRLPFADERLFRCQESPSPSPARCGRCPTSPAGLSRGRCSTASRPQRTYRRPRRGHVALAGVDPQYRSTPASSYTSSSPRNRSRRTTTRAARAGGHSARPVVLSVSRRSRRLRRIERPPPVCSPRHEISRTCRSRPSSVKEA